MYAFLSDLDRMQNFYQQDLKTRQVSNFTAYCDEEWVRALFLVSSQATSQNQSLINCEILFYTGDIFVRTFLCSIA